MYYILLFFSRFLSSVLGFLAHIRPPTWLNRIIVNWYIRTYKVDLKEIAEPKDSFRSIGEFFIRKLSDGSRPIAPSPGSLASPVDGVLRSSGLLRPGVSVLVKNQVFNWDSFLGDAALAREFEDGTFFNFYLSPKDYHHVHFPFSGVISEYLHLPGALLPVNDWSINRFPNLFSENERVVAAVQASGFKFLVVMIGALNVGSIELAFASKFKRSMFSLKNKVYALSTPFPAQKGDRFGSFQLGSSVVCVFPKGVVENISIADGTSVIFGQSMANISVN